MFLFSFKIDMMLAKIQVISFQLLIHSYNFGSVCQNIFLPIIPAEMLEMCLRDQHLGICACEIISRITLIVEVCGRYPPERSILTRRRSIFNAVKGIGYVKEADCTAMEDPEDVTDLRKVDLGSGQELTIVTALVDRVAKFPL